MLIVFLSPLLPPCHNHQGRHIRQEVNAGYYLRQSDYGYPFPCQGIYGQHGEHVHHDLAHNGRLEYYIPNIVYDSQKYCEKPCRG